jgi:hypothetical protein
VTPAERAEYAAILGVPADASAEHLRRAWRAWAQLLHPDHGGDDATFIRVREAYDALISEVGDPITPAQMAAARAHPCVARPDDATSTSAAMREPAPRPPLRSVLVAPGQPFFLSLLIGVAIAAAALPSVIGLSVISVLPAAILSGLAAVTLAYRCLTDGSDAGHRVVVAAIAWALLTAVQIAVSVLAGASILAMLPLLALPLVAFTSWVLFPGWPLRRTRR